MATTRAAPTSPACHGQNSRHSHHHGSAFLFQQHFTKHRFFSILRNCTASLSPIRALCLFHVEWLNFFLDKSATVSLPTARSIHLSVPARAFTSTTIFVTTTTLTPARIRLPSLGYIHGIYPQNKTYPSSRYLLCLFNVIYATFRPLLGRLICLLRRERVSHFLCHGRRELRSGDRKGERIGERPGALGQRYIHTHARQLNLA